MKLNSEKIGELLYEYDEHSAIQPKELCDECKEIGFCKSRNQKGYEMEIFNSQLILLFNMRCLIKRRQSIKLWKHLVFIANTN